MSRWLRESDEVPDTDLKLFVAMRGGCLALEMKPMGVIFVVIYRRGNPFEQLLLKTKVYYDLDRVSSWDLDRLLHANADRIDWFLRPSNRDDY